MKIKHPKSHKAMFTPKDTVIKDEPVPILGEVMRYFVIKGNNDHPMDVQIATFKDGVKVQGHEFIPDNLTDKTFCFESLDDMEKYRCPCGKPNCLYNPYLFRAITNFRKQLLSL
jgi:hypothetical protein